MPTTILENYQRTLTRSLFGGATLLLPSLALVNLIRYWQTGLAEYSIQVVTFLLGTLITWLCWRWLQRNERLILADRLGISALLVVCTIFCLTVSPSILVAGAVSFIMVVIYTSMISTRRWAWFWCGLAGLLYWGAMVARFSLQEAYTTFDPIIKLSIFIFPPAIFALLTRGGTDVVERLQIAGATNDQLQRDLEFSELQTRQLVQNMNEGFEIVDENEVIVYVNDRYCEIFGFTRAELTGRSYMELLDIDSVNRQLIEAETAQRRQGERSSYEISARRKDGALLTVLVSAMPNQDRAGNFRGTTSVVMDITERKQMEASVQAERTQLQQTVAQRTASLRAANVAIQHELTERQEAERSLQATQAEYSIIYDHVQTGIYHTSWDGRSLRGNLALAQINGYSSAAEASASFQGIAGEWYVEPTRHAELLRLLEQNGHVHNLESEVRRHKTGEHIWISENATLIRDASGQPLYYMGTVRDITQRKQMDEQRERLIAELAHIAVMKDEFLANMSHELRTPLNGILGLTEALREQIYGPLNPRQEQALTSVDASGQHLLALINDILDLAKIEAGQTELTREWLEVDILCQECLRFVQPTADKKQLLLTYLPAPNLQMIHADNRRLKQILINLLSNAVKFTASQGTVVLAVSADAAQQFVRFQVRDTGVGIHPEAIGRLFTPFVQLDSGLARQYEGTGLGLALVAHLVDLHGGSVAAESEVGQGSCFTVTLPWPATQPQTLEIPLTPTEDMPGDSALSAYTQSRFPTSTQAEPPSTPALLALPATPPPDALAYVLLAEDNTTTAAMIAEYLTYKGCRVKLAYDGVQALALARQETPGVILMDLQMPGMDGLEATRHLRLMPQCAHLPIIALTALAMSADRERALAAGASEYMTKPVRLEQLATAVERYLQPASQL